MPAELANLNKMVTGYLHNNYVNYQLIIFNEFRGEN